MDSTNKKTPQSDNRSETERLRSKLDDPLLLALLTLCKLLHTPHSSDALTAGLPLVNDKLNPELFIRAASRAGLSAGLIKRPLTSISNRVLPAVLLLKEGQTCILQSHDGEQLSIILPENIDGKKTVKLSDLEAEYTGTAIFVQQAHQFDERTEETSLPKAKHWFWDVIYKSWPIYSEVLVASLLVNVFALASPLFIMNVYDRVVPNNALETLWVLAIGVAIVYTFDLIIKSLRGFFIDSAGKRADIILSATIFEKVMGIRMEARPASVGAFANNLQEFESFREFLTSATLTTLIDLPFLFLFILVIWMLGGNLALVPLIILPLAILAGLAIQKPLRNTINELFQYSAQKGATLIETLTCLETIKGTCGEGQIQRQWEQNIGQIARLSLKSRFLSSCAVNFTAFLQQSSSIAVVVMGVYMIADGELTTGALIACVILTGRALAPVAQVASLLTRYQQAKISLGSLNKMMELPVEREPGKKYLHRATFKGAIEFKNVSFSYPQQEVKALENVSFKIAAGEKVGFIGRIGSGKSTIEKLLMGLYQPQEGSIYIDGTDIRQIDPSDLRRQMGYVPQDISLLYGSVKDNITLGARFADDSHILTAAEIAGVTQFVNKHPSGFDLAVGERGSALSGGQRQSVAVARALLLSPPIFIMDEPTNSMDSSSEEVFKRKFSEYLDKRTLLLVTHRSTLLTLVNRLIVIDGGHVLADGAKDQVMEALKKGRIKASS